MRDGGDGNESGERPSPRGQSLIIQKCRHSLQICRSVSIIDTNHDHIYMCLQIGLKIFPEQEHLLKAGARNFELGYRSS